MLSIGIGYAANHPPSGVFPCLALNDDGYYWFLHPLFDKLAAETGQYIDLYGNASFAATDLAALERMLKEARTLVLSQPESWEVHTGTQLRPVCREIYHPVRREEFLPLLDTWENIIAIAKESGRPVVSFGG
jgi:hypothetical protein